MRQWIVSPAGRIGAIVAIVGGLVLAWLHLRATVGRQRVPDDPYWFQTGGFHGVAGLASVVVVVLAAMAWRVRPEGDA